MKRTFLFAVGIISSFLANAQQADTLKSLVIHKDPRIDMLIKKQASINESSIKEQKHSDKGYRILVISTTNRDEAMQAKSKMYQYFPELKNYLWHQSPYYKLKVGNFEARPEAESYRRKLNTYFPKGVFIMGDIIEVKPSKEKDDDD